MRETEEREIEVSETGRGVRKEEEGERQRTEKDRGARERRD